MNGNVQEDLGLIIEFQAAVLRALKPAIFEMKRTTMQGWIGNNPALKQALARALCPPSNELLDLSLADVFTPERCTRWDPSLRSRAITQITYELRNDDCQTVRLRRLLQCSESELREFPNVGRKVIALVKDVLDQLGLSLRPE